MLTELIHVGHKYFTQDGDVVEIAERVPATDGGGRHVHLFNARVLTVVKGHEGLLGRVMKFDAEGHWISHEGVTMMKSIHNLKEEACDDAL